jgi:hypothetical protein
MLFFTMFIKRLLIVSLYPSVLLSVHMIPLDNHWTDLDDIWYVSHAIGVCLKIIHVMFLESVIPTWRTNEIVRCT